MDGAKLSPGPGRDDLVTVSKYKSTVVGSRGNLIWLFRPSHSTRPSYLVVDDTEIDGSYLRDAYLPAYFWLPVVSAGDSTEEIYGILKLGVLLGQLLVYNAALPLLPG